MAYQQKDNSGVLFTNDKKQSDKHPDYKGNCTIDGQKYWISGWKKTSSKGTFLSLAFKAADVQQQEVTPPF
jgi:uncharacterized protein (DUF736 family)